MVDVELSHHSDADAEIVVKQLNEYSARVEFYRQHITHHQFEQDYHKTGNWNPQIYILKKEEQTTNMYKNQELEIIKP